MIARKEWLVGPTRHAALLTEESRLYSPDQVAAFQLSVQFARAHGIQHGVQHVEITTLCSGYRLQSEAN